MPSGGSRKKMPDLLSLALAEGPLRKLVWGRILWGSTIFAHVLFHFGG